ncbi:MAG: spermidine/putrescine ABC transporter substrate-binding protein [Anaerolineae bacterium]|nr:spermidine/putrescine ABC transporter substrate-binding protein [Anaerolineae bacterium]
MKAFQSLIVVLVLFGALGITAAQESEFETEWVCPEGFAGQTLNVYNWATYIGSETVPTFEELCDVTVNYDTFDTNESLIARLRQGNPGYDVAFPNEYAVTIMIRDELIQPINLENIPNFSNIAEKWQGMDFDPENQYSVPYLWGTMGIGINTERVQEPITSWTQFFEHDGPVSLIADIRSTFPIALTMLGLDPNSTDPAEIEAAYEYLLENSGNVVAFNDGTVSILELGEVDMAVVYSGDAYELALDCECDTYVYVVPEEGSIADISNAVIPVGAQNPALAEVFIDYLLDPAVNAAIINERPYATPNQAAIDSGLIDEALLNNPAVMPDEEALQNLFFLEDVSEVEQVYNDFWDQLRIFAGQ